MYSKRTNYAIYDKELGNKKVLSKAVCIWLMNSDELSGYRISGQYKYYFLYEEEQ